MKRLIIVRHAKSSWKEPFRTDFERPLNSRGKSDAPEMGRRLAARGIEVDLVVTSPARRARKTARIIARHLGLDKADIKEERGIYEAGLPGLVDLVRGFDKSADRVMVVGHNPGFTDLSNFLTTHRIVNIPTCGVLCIDFDVDGWPALKRGAGRTVFYDYPKRPGTPSAD